jgi:hypothetical protein
MCDRREEVAIYRGEHVVEKGSRRSSTTVGSQDGWWGNCDVRGWRPMAEGGARAGECGRGAWR